MGTSLADSNICRLCGIESENTVFIFNPQDDEPFCVKINKYMPFQVYDDGRHPRHVCGACHSGVTATQVFLDGVLSGQRAIAALLQPSGPAPSNPPALYPPDNALRQQLEADGVVLQKRRPGRPRKGEYSRKDPGTTPVAKPIPPPQQQQQQQPSPSPPLVRSHRQRGRLPARFQDTVKGGELERVLGGGDLVEVDGDDDPPTTAGEGAESAAPCHIRVEILAAPDERGRALVGGTGVKMEPLSPAAAEHAGEKDTQAHDAPAPAPRGPGRGRRRKVRFQCDVCGKRFLYEGRLEFHRALHRGVRYECLGCSARFKLSAELSFHQTETGHTGQGIVEGVDSETLVDASRLPCPHCQLTFSTAHTLESHMLERHNPDKMYECNVCHKKFGQPGPLNTHQKSHLGRFHRQRRNCPECDKVCNSKTALNYHMETAHNTSRVLICNICGKSFQQKQLLTRHIAFVHSNERNFKCTWCPLAFKTKSHLSTHMLRHTGERPHGCPLCPRRFAHKTSLTLHLKWHRGEKPHECPICQKAFTQHSNMMEHQRTHTGERPFPCTFCSRAFTTNNQLQTHLRVHGAGRPLVCRPCGKTFTSRERWKAHCRLHGPRRPLACTTCGKQMSNKWSLRSHMRTHDGKKAPADSGAPILVCSVCSWTCEDAASLQRHQESTHGGGGDGTGQQLLASAGSLKQAESQVIYVTCQNPADPSTVQLVDGVTAAVGGARPVQLSADSEVLLEDAADGVVQLAANKGLITAEGTRTLELTTEDGRRIQITLQDVKGDLEPAELAAAAAAPEVGGGGEGTAALHAAAETEQVEVEDTQDLEGESVDVLVTASDGRQFRLVTPAGSDPVQLATEYIAGLGGTLG